MNQADHFYMKEALKLAARGRGQTSPNPMVGAIVVQGDQVVGTGWHEAVGGPHAEVNALRNAGPKAVGGTLYVTLEPCNHYGRTPPCTKAVLEAGISRVVVGMNDPNPLVSGGGADTLRARGITVDAGICEQECRRLNQAFIKHVTTGIPFVTIKAAATLDGRIATRSGDSRWISNERSRAFVHRLRCDLDGILVGIGTALADDPQLTSRLSGTKSCRQPTRIVLDTHLAISMKSRLVQSAGEVPVWIACGQGIAPEKERELSEAGAQVLCLPTENDHIHLHSLLQELGKRNVTSLLVEGGARVLGAFLENGLADDFYFFYAPKILGDPQGVSMICGGVRERMADAVQVYDIRVRRFGDDVMLSGRFRERLY